MIRFNSVLASVLFMAFSTPSLFAQPTPVVLKKDDRIVFLGDSITAGGNGGKGYIQVIRNEFAEKKKDLAIGAGGHDDWPKPTSSTLYCTQTYLVRLCTESVY